MCINKLKGNCFSNKQPDIFAVMNCCVVALSVFSSILVYIQCQGRTQGVLGLNSPLKRDILQKLDYLRKRRFVFAYLLLVNLST